MVWCKRKVNKCPNCGNCGARLVSKVHIHTYILSYSNQPYASYTHHLCKFSSMMTGDHDWWSRLVITTGDHDWWSCALKYVEENVCQSWIQSCFKSCFVLKTGATPDRYCLENQVSQWKTLVNRLLLDHVTVIYPSSENTHKCPLVCKFSKGSHPLTIPLDRCLCYNHAYTVHTVSLVVLSFSWSGDIVSGSRSA